MTEDEMRARVQHALNETFPDTVSAPGLSFRGFSWQIIERETGRFDYKLLQAPEMQRDAILNVVRRALGDDAGEEIL